MGFQFHLSSMIVVTLMCGYLFLINFLVYRDLDPTLSKGIDAIGWPFPLAIITPVFHEETSIVGKSGPLAPGESRFAELKFTDQNWIVGRSYTWRPAYIALDAAAALGVTVALATLVEAWIRCRRAQAPRG
jgi:hypothetical protein